MNSDIWFRTEKSLEQIGEILGLVNISYDVENYWEWILGNYGEFRVDVTRAHTVSPEETETRVFLLGDNRTFTNELIRDFSGKLKLSGVSTIYIGKWVYVKGNDFDLQVREKIT
ncbi:hypothetical protein ACJJIR_15020 [Microbulbifer sp. SSSA008]|uniref:hypothetical protein n=1 Tax=Microbulbifer sp. SSSA008 TaxID=3243380 RepID=UPI0040392294